MRIAYIAAGAGAMYCGACARDLTLVRGLLARGHDVQVLPVYTPLRSDQEFPRIGPLFYGGIQCYLEQLSPLFARLPRFLDPLLSSGALLRGVARVAVSTHPRHLGPLTVSVLVGKEGRQARELAKLVAYLKEGPPPHVVSLTNALLSGMAPELRAQLGVPIACALQGEEGFVEALLEPHASEARRWMRQNARAVDLFVAPGAAYADKMAAFLEVPREKICVIRTGLDAAAYPLAAPRRRTPFTLGYLSVITPKKGLDLAVAAFKGLAGAEHREVILRVAGRVLNRQYWRAQVQAVRAAGLLERFEYCGEVDWAGKLALLQSCSAFTVPSRFEEARGLAVMEAMACGVPVAVPAAGIFPELLAQAGGGVTFPLGDAAALARELARLMDAPDAADALGRTGAEGIRREYPAAGMAAQVEEAYAALGR